mmetsp:Transcript_1108/g.4491  ORF Transcript_1108/g.4491 Transcript_1108/m.4491 type:complete len:249 (+) Transcript_1108:6421-7167(+)
MHVSRRSTHSPLPEQVNCREQVASSQYLPKKVLPAAAEHCGHWQSPVMLEHCPPFWQRQVVQSAPPKPPMQAHCMEPLSLSQVHSPNGPHEGEQGAIWHVLLAAAYSMQGGHSQAPVAALHVPSSPQEMPSPVRGSTPGQAWSQLAPQKPSRHTHASIASRAPPQPLPDRSRPQSVSHVEPPPATLLWRQSEPVALQPGAEQSMPAQPSSQVHAPSGWQMPWLEQGGGSPPSPVPPGHCFSHRSPHQP